MKRKPNRYWTKERCRIEALKYNTRSNFCDGSVGAYTAALKKGCLDEICTHMIIKWRPLWNKESCEKEALKYTTRTEFQENAVGAWTAASKKGWLDEICSHMIVKWQIKWNKETCQSEAKKYANRTDFQKNASGAWAAASKKGWLDEICVHMEVIGNLFNRCIYAFEFPDNHVYVGLTDNLERRILQHLNSTKSPVYIHIKENKIYPICKLLHEYTDRRIAQKLEGLVLTDYVSKGWKALNRTKTGALGGTEIYWTKERCSVAAKEYSVKTLFIKNCSGAYASSIRNGWLDEVCAHMTPYRLTGNSIVRRVQTDLNQIRKNVLYPLVITEQISCCIPKWTFESLKEEANKYKSKQEFILMNCSAYNIASKKKIINDICSHMIPIYKHANYWIKERCQVQSLLYKTRMEFKKNDASAYTASVRGKWLDDICTHMVKPQPKRRWTTETLKNEARKYKSKREFVSGNSSAYTTALKLGIMNDICNHMTPLCKEANYWTKEECQTRSLLYKTRMEFKKYDGSAYTTSVRNKWLDEICTHMVKPDKKVKWTTEALETEAKKYKNKKEFKSNSYSAYVTALRLKIIDQICTHMPKRKKIDKLPE